jgi:hypothetical protein
VAGVNYEVNIQLNTKSVDKQLGDLEKRVSALKKNLAAPGRTEQQSTQATARAAEKLANLRQMSTRAQILNINLGDKIAQLEAKGLDLSQARYNLNKAAEAQGKNQLIIAQTRNKLARDFYNDALKTLKVQERQTAEQKRQTANAAKAAKASRNQRLQGVALGAGFPLLFGGGPGAILGGAAGGLVGGPAGFAAQIALSALGQQLDKFATATFETAKAFTSTSGAFDLMNEKMLFSTDAAMEHAIALEEQGKATELAQFLANDMAKAIGNNGVQALKDLGDESKETTKQWNLLTIQLQRLVAGPLTGFLKALNQVLGQVTTGASYKGFLQDISPEARSRAEARFKELTGTEAQRRKMARTGRKIPGLIGTVEAQQQIMREMAGERPAAPAFDVTGADLRSITAPKEKKPKKGRRSRLGDFQADLAQAQELFTLEKSIYQARFNDDRRALIRFEKVRELLSIREKEQTVVASDRSEAEKKAQLDALALERKRASLEETYKLAALERTMGQERGKAMLVAIEQQNQLNLGLQQQLQLADSLSQVLGQGLTNSFDLLINGAQNWGMALRDIAANVLRDIARQLIQIYVIEQAVGFLRQAFGPGPQFGPNYSVDGVGTAGPNFGIPQRARGGAVSANQPYMVGERGPELFVPGASGNIVPNHAMGGVQVGSINITVENTGEQLSPAAQKQIANQVQGIVMSTLVNERRSGGVLR